MDNISVLKSLTESLKEKKRLLSEILVLTNAEAKAINDDDTDVLNKHLDEKNSIISSIDKLDEDFNNKYNALKERLQVSSLDLAAELPRNLLTDLRTETEGILDMMKEVSQIHESNRQRAKELKDNLAAEIRRINTSMQASNIYKGNSSFQGSYFIDKKK